jgi:hypothetical protein
VTILSWISLIRDEPGIAVTKEVFYKSWTAFLKAENPYDSRFSGGDKKFRYTKIIA